jgi:PAS domain S-box-containing protein
MGGPSESDLRRLFERAPLGMYQSTSDGRFTYVNPAFVRMLGYDSVDQVLALDIARDIYIDAAERSALLERYQRGGVVSGVELHWKTRQGQPLTVAIYGDTLRGADGETIGFEATVLDVTAHRAAQEEALRSQSTLRVVLEQLPALVWTVDRDLKMRSSEGSGLALLGLRPGDLRGMTLAEYFGAADPCDPVIQHHQRALEGHTAAYEFEWNGLVFQTTVVPLRDGSGAIDAALGMAVDITEQKRMALRVQVAQKIESLGILAGGVAHDFSNLLAAMLGNADLALRETAPSHPARDAIQNIKIAGQRAAELTGQLLAYSGKGQLVVREINLNQIVDEIASILRVSLAKQATLLVDLTPNLAVVRADPSQLRQIVINLMTNASDAMEERAGTIRLRTYMRRVDRAFIESLEVVTEIPEGTYVCFEVTDTGHGMDQAVRRKIFDPFFTTKVHGHGLGLAAVIGIVRGHGGALRVDSEPGRGTRFEVLLPAVGAIDAIEMIDGDETGPLPPPVWRRDTRILVVDDEDLVRDVLARMLEELGYTALVAADGPEALAMLEQDTAIDAVILDMTMPGMGGADAFRRMRRMRPELRIILCSGYEEQPVVDGVADGFVRKPFQLETLETSLAAYLGGPSATAPVL